MICSLSHLFTFNFSLLITYSVPSADGPHLRLLPCRFLSTAVGENVCGYAFARSPISTSPFGWEV